MPPHLLADFLPAPAQTITPGLGDRPKNLIVIVGESVGAHYLSLYGNPLKTWPCMESEAAHSMIFDNYYSHIENTSDALFSLTLSRYAPHTWQNATATNPRHPGITAAQVLKQHGFRTAFISGGDNSYANQNSFLKNRGFDSVRDFRDAGVKKAFSWGLDDQSTIDMVIKSIDEDRSKPFYICAWTQATHHPFYVPPAHEDDEFLPDDTAITNIVEDLNNYLNGLAELDRQLARLFDALRQRGLADQTAVLITGDHGQAFGPPHNGYFHSGNVYQEDVHVPCMIWCPRLFSNQPRSETIGAHIDIAPTVLDFLGIDSPEGWVGHSLLQPATDSKRHAYFFGMRNDFIFGIREGAYKYIFNFTQDSDELYNLQLDPTEQHNLSPEEPELRTRLRQQISAWMLSQKDPDTTKRPRP